MAQPLGISAHDHIIVGRDGSKVEATSYRAGKAAVKVSFGYSYSFQPCAPAGPDPEVVGVGGSALISGN